MAAESKGEGSDTVKKEAAELTSTEKETMKSQTKEEESVASNKRSSPVQAGSPTGSIRSHQPPIMTNSVPNRPPSTTSVHSNSSGGPRSTTATSRRGGRTRSRSPPMMIQQRPSSAGPGPTPPDAPYATVDDRGAPTSPANPSAAAAAAAAAAKSIARNGPPPPGTWYESQEARDRDYRRSRGDSRFHGRYYEGGPPPPQLRHNWPEEEGISAQGANRPPTRNRYPPRRPGEEYYGYHDGYSYRKGGRSNRGERFGPYEEDYDRRYPDRRHDERGSQGTSPRPHGYDYRGRGHRHPREEQYYKQGKEMEGHPETSGQSMVKRTTRVIGTATPIHMPRAGEQQTGSRGRSTSGSIFRGRPGGEMRKPPIEKEEDNSQKILMALRTPSTSFEEKNSKDVAKRAGDPVSPEAPPQIQHSHHPSGTDSNLFFEPQRSPKSAAGPPQQTSSIDMAPSFTLFNQSFDSIGDTTNFFNDSTLQSTSFGAGLAAGSDVLTI